MDKQLKAIILASIIFLLPIKTWGYFATPDNMIHSMNFGEQKSALESPINLEGTYPNAMQTQFLQNTLEKHLNNEPEKKSQNIFSAMENTEAKKFMAGVNIPLLIFIFAIFLVVIVFILLKLKKVV